MINIATGRTIRVFEGHEGAVSSVCVHEVTGTTRYLFLIRTVSYERGTPVRLLTDFSQVDTAGFVNFGAGKSPGAADVWA